MKLIVLAGCNGAGKSTYGRELIKPFIDDLSFIYVDNDIVAKFLDNKGLDEHEVAQQVQEYFIKSSKDAISENKCFIYESNLRVNPFEDILRFRQAGYEAILLFLTLANVEKSIERVNHRVTKEQGNFVSLDDINTNFTQGLLNLDVCFKRKNYFDVMYIFECDKNIPILSVSIRNGIIEHVRDIPAVIKERWTPLILKHSTDFLDNLQN